MATATQTIHYFKRYQTKGKYNYYQVHGGKVLRGNTGYQIVVCFLNKVPAIAVEHNYYDNGRGTWDTFEVGEPITEAEYKAAYDKAIDNPDCKIY